MPVTLVLTIATFVVGVDLYIVAAVLPAIADDLHEPIGLVGLLASAYALPTAIFAPLFGPVSDRRGRRAGMLIGLSIFTAAAAACTVAPSLPLLLVARAINGLGAAIVSPATLAYASDLPSPRERARTLGIVLSAFPFSTLIGLPIGALVTGIFGWRAAFAFVLVVAFAAVLGISRLPADRPNRASRTGYLESYRTILRDRRALGVLLVTFAWFAGTFGYFVYQAEFFHEAFGLPTNVAGLSYLVVGVVGVAATRLSGRFLHLVGARRAVMIGIAAFAVAAFLMPLTRVSLPLALLVFAGWAFGTWFGIPGIQTIVAGLSATLRGTMLAFNSSAQNFGNVLGPAVVGQVLAIGGFSLAGPWSAGVGLVALVIAWRFLPRTLPERDPAEPAMAVESL
ncbi:MAG TPA: MFS transporter [Candidatus Limnocylindrales bacterium]|nr:MFS transporter [Candidatus Limnocylindrales bacterium]